MHNREAEPPIVPSVVTMIVVDITGTAVVGVADDQAMAASTIGKNFFKTRANRRPRDFQLS